MGAARRLAVLGHPVGHSRSPAMQNAALAELGLGEEWRYEAIDVPPEDLEARVRAMPGEGFAGANVTVPHKAAALALADAPTEIAREIGAANTLTFEGGRIGAENTDAGGLLDALRGEGVHAGARRALVLGAGGAARAAVWALAREGESIGVAGVDVWNRTAERAGLVVAELGGRAVVEPLPADYGLLVNTTAVGLRGEDPLRELPLAGWDFGGRAVADMVYGERPSALLEAAAADGAAATVDGLEILVRQGARSLEIWTGREAPLATMRAAARREAHL